MYGYIKPNKPEMKIKEFEIYRGFYCSLCGTLGKRYGFPARLLLSYDLTCFLIFALSINSKKCCFSRCRCPINPAKKCLKASDNSDFFNYCADITVVLAYYKLKDTIQDSSFLKKILAYALLPYFKLLMRKTKKYIPETVKHTEIYISKQFRVENSPETDIDAACFPTMELIAFLAASVAEENGKHAAYDFGLMLGRYIYLADAFDDLEKDIKNSSFNPFVNQYSITTNNISDKAAECAREMEFTVSAVTDAYRKNQTDSYSEILCNIIETGLYEQIDIIKNKYQEV